MACRPSKPTVQADRPSRLKIGALLRKAYGGQAPSGGSAQSFATESPNHRVTELPSYRVTELPWRLRCLGCGSAFLEGEAGVVGDVVGHFQGGRTAEAEDRAELDVGEAGAFARAVQAGEAGKVEGAFGGAVGGDSGRRRRHGRRCRRNGCIGARRRRH